MTQDGNDHLLTQVPVVACPNIRGKATFLVSWRESRLNTLNLAMKTIFLAFVMTLTVRAASLDAVLTPEQFAKAAYALSHEGDPENGEKLFHDKTRLSCTLCHQIFGREIHRPAPNLFGVGDKFTGSELIRAIEKPSAFVLPGFETTQITTIDGGEVVGILRSVSAKSGYAITDIGSETHHISHDQVAARKTMEFSLMPEGLTAGLSAEEYGDLIAFLMDQKTTGLAGLQGKDEAAEIVILRKPVSLTPFHGEENSFIAPVFATLFPSAENQLVVLEHQAGKVWRLIKDIHDERKELFLDMSSKRELAADGLVGIAFHPDFLTNQRYYIKYNALESDQLKTIIEERLAGSDGLKDSGQASRRLLELDQPAGNHNGGHIGFGPDGYLYTAFGDGGPQKDPNGMAQNLNRIHGAMLRIDVNGRSDGKPYAIPNDNPFVEAHQSDANIRAEIWAYGFREPWQFSFDGDTGELWLGDVGQVRYEEVSIVRKGENHGWNVYEGFDEFSDEYRLPKITYTPPVFAYSRQLGTSVTGGHVYRGDRNSPLFGYYICGDHESRRLFALKHEDRRLTKVYELGFSPQRISAFARDASGELLIVGYQGTLYRMDLATVDLTPR